MHWISMDVGQMFGPVVMLAVAAWSAAACGGGTA
jgi:hypothetical protein